MQVLGFCLNNDWGTRQHPGNTSEDPRTGVAMGVQKRLSVLIKRCGWSQGHPDSNLTSDKVIILRLSFNMEENEKLTVLLGFLGHLLQQ